MRTGCCVGFLRDDRACRRIHSYIGSSHGDQTSLLLSCKRLPDGMLVHDTFIRNAPSHSSPHGNSLLQMYTGFGASEEALALFRTSPLHDASAWTLIIRAHTEITDVALFFLQQMLQEGVFLNKFASIAILFACADEESLAHGKRIHTIIFASGLEKDVYVATAILSMYNNCHGINNALATFERIPKRDTVAWNAMLAAYVNVGNAEEALKLFYNLIKEGFSPTKATFLSALEAYVCLTSLGLGHIDSILEHISAQGLQGDIAIGNALINMYSKCGSIENAQAVFNNMPQHDTITWNTMIAAYALHGQEKDTLVLFQRIQEEKISMDNVTFVSLLSAGTNSVTSLAGEQIHHCIVCVGMDLDVVVGTALVNMYGKSKSLQEAYYVFSSLSKRDIITWNAMISAYGQNGFCDAALLLFDRMHLDDIKPDKVTYVSVIDACACQENFEEGRKVHNLIHGSELERDVIVGTSLIKMYGACECLVEAKLVFEKILEKDIIIWNSMIALYVEHEKNNKALLCSDQMLQEGFLPNKATVTGLLNVCARKNAVAMGKRIHACCVGTSFELDVVVGTALIRMYSECGCFQDAYHFFDSMHERDLIAWTTMISLHSQQEHYDEAFQLFVQLQQEGLVPDIVTFVGMISSCASKEALLICRRIHASVVKTAFIVDLILGNALVCAYDKCGSMKEALLSFEQMRKRDNVSLLNMVCACASEAALREGQKVFSTILASGVESDPTLSHALVNFYGKCGILKDARKVFDLTSERNVVAWNAMIAAYSQIGNGEEALLLFEQMQNGETEPDSFTFISILTACSHAGLVDEGCGIFSILSHNLSASLISDHYNCMLDIFARAGQLNEAEQLINIIPSLPTLVTWTTLLGACKNVLDVTRGECVALHAMSLVRGDVAIQVSLSNIYSAAGRIAMMER